MALFPQAKDLIDGQQRVTALQAAIAGQMVIDANYEKNYIAGRYGAIPYILND